MKSNERWPNYSTLREFFELHIVLAICVLTDCATPPYALHREPLNKLA